MFDYWTDVCLARQCPRFQARGEVLHVPPSSASLNQMLKVRDNLLFPGFRALTGKGKLLVIGIIYVCCFFDALTSYHSQCELACCVSQQTRVIATVLML